ncbi:GNAT family N-acetyltransferase [Patescibacteria group bacterium]|nr:GNAT family N-acetyltransferase [Patescibacteria group bacterium]
MEVNYNIRTVIRGDSKRIWEIRNQPATREYSKNSAAIPFAQHDFWFENKYFKGDKNICFVLEKDNKVVGYCRFDFDDKNNNYITSIALAPDCQGKGLGHKLLSGSLIKFKTDKAVLAEVKKDNITSAKLFQKNNFHVFKKDKKNYFYKYN